MQLIPPPAFNPQGSSATDFWSLLSALPRLRTSRAMAVVLLCTRCPQLEVLPVQRRHPFGTYRKD